MSFNLTILSRDGQIFKGVCNTVTSFNAVGEFDVLEHHANFITMINKYVVVDKSTAEEKKFQLEKGVLSSKGDVVEVFIQD